MNLSDITDIAVSGLAAQRVRMAVTSSNLANAETTKAADGGAYQRRDPVFGTAPVGGPFAERLDRLMSAVETTGIRLDPRPGIERYQPSHPHANEEGYVTFPRVNVVEELTNMMSAKRSYEANLMIIGKVRAMAQAAMQIGR